MPARGMRRLRAADLTATGAPGRPSCWCRLSLRDAVLHQASRDVVEIHQVSPIMCFSGTFINHPTFLMQITMLFFVVRHVELSSHRRIGKAMTKSSLYYLTQTHHIIWCSSEIGDHHQFFLTLILLKSPFAPDPVKMPPQP